MHCLHPILVGLVTISGYVLTDDASIYFWIAPVLLQLGGGNGCLFGRCYTVWTVGIWSEGLDCGGYAQCMVTNVMMKSTYLVDNKRRLALPSPTTSKYSRAVTTPVNADLNVYRAFAQLDHLITQSDCRLVLLFVPACVSSSNSS